MPGDLPDAAASSLSPDLEADPSTDSHQPPPTIKVAVLLDGDADFHFTSAYLLKGYRGGRSAALDLRNKVNALVHNRYRQVAGALARPPEVFIVAQSFFNMVGLSNHLRSVDLRTFAQGFSSSSLAFSMVDVGSQKQAADDAIKAHLPFLLATCEVVLLGGSHDGGYAADLLRLDPEVLRTKVVLLRTTDFAAERILELGLDEVRFEGLFDGTDPSSGRKPAFLARASAPAVPFFASNAMVPFQPVRKPSLPGGTSAASTLKPPPSAWYSSAVALRSNGLVASASSAPPKNSTTTEASTAPAPAPEPYAPLVLVLRDFASRGQRRPSRADVEQALRVRYPALRGYFKRYALEAALKGIIRLGKGETVAAAWVELVEEAAGPAVQQGEQGKEEIKSVAAAGGTSSGASRAPLSVETPHGPLLDPAVASTSTSPAPPPVLTVSSTSTSTPAPSTTTISSTPATQSRFMPLIALLESQRRAGRARPLRSLLGQILAKSHPDLYAHFTTYCREAASEGLVRMGVGKVNGSEWIELASNMPMITTSNSTAASSSFFIPPSFVPLVSVLRSMPGQSGTWTTIGEKLNKVKPMPYAPGNFRAYVERAEQEGSSAKAAAGPSSNPVESTSATLTSSSPSSATANTSTFTIPPAFLPLVTVILDCSWPAPSWVHVGKQLNKLDSLPYEKGKLKAYVERAEEAGIVETGEPVEGQQWMKLTAAARAAVQLSASGGGGASS
ncbi:hypothetical protein JCM9279_000566 [Rhodotorula babjevae]